MENEAIKLHRELRIKCFTDAQIAASLLMCKEQIIHIVDDSPFWSGTMNSGRNALGKIFTLIRTELEIKVFKEALSKEKEEIVLECLEPYIFETQEETVIYLLGLGFQQYDAEMIARDVYF